MGTGWCTSETTYSVARCRRNIANYGRKGHSVRVNVTGIVVSSMINLIGIGHSNGVEVRIPAMLLGAKIPDEPCSRLVC